jgi:hypothetical protein
MSTDDNGGNHSVATAPEAFHDLIDGAGVSLLGSFGDGTWPTGFSPGGFIYPSPGLPGTGRSEDGGSLQATCLPLITQENGSSICLDTQGVMTPQLLGSSGDMDPLLMSRYQYDTSGAFHFKNLNIQSVSSGTNPTQFLLSKPSIFATSREENGCENVSAIQLRQELESLVPEDIGLRLINLFERIVAPDYPILPPGELNPGTSPPYLLALNLTKNYALIWHTINHQVWHYVKLSIKRSRMRYMHRSFVLCKQCFFWPFGLIQTQLCWIVASNGLNSPL